MPSYGDAQKNLNNLDGSGGIPEVWDAQCRLVAPVGDSDVGSSGKLRVVTGSLNTGLEAMLAQETIHTSLGG